MLVAPERFGEQARALVRRTENELFLSAASAWEIAIKWGLGKLELPEPPARAVPQLMTRTAVTPLPIQHSHALHVAELPSHHRDPFDRILIAQARLESLPILTVDPLFDPYEVERVPA